MDQIVIADKLIKDQEDNLELLVEIGEDVQVERLALNEAKAKRDRIVNAVNKRLKKVEHKGTSGHRKPKEN